MKILRGIDLKIYINGVEITPAKTCTDIEWKLINLLGKLGLKTCQGFAYVSQTYQETDTNTIMLSSPIKNP